MLTWIWSILILAVAILAVARLVPGIKVEGFETALSVALVYAILNKLFLKLLILLTLPITILSLGLFVFVLNAVLLKITSEILDDFELEDFKTTLVGSVGISIVSSLLHWVF